MQLQCPYCEADNVHDAKVCLSCKQGIAWVKHLHLIEDDIKSREPSRVRATITLIEEAIRAKNGGPGVSIAAVKGFATAWLMPRAMLVIGSIIGGLMIALQTAILFQQNSLVAEQNKLIADQGTVLRSQSQMMLSQTDAMRLQTRLQAEEADDASQQRILRLQQIRWSLTRTADTYEQLAGGGRELLEERNFRPRDSEAAPPARRVWPNRPSFVQPIQASFSAFVGNHPLEVGVQPFWWAFHNHTQFATRSINLTSSINLQMNNIEIWTGVFLEQTLRPAILECRHDAELGMRIIGDEVTMGRLLAPWPWLPTALAERTTPSSEIISQRQRHLFLYEEAMRRAERETPSHLFSEPRSPASSLEHLAVLLNSFRKHHASNLRLVAESCGRAITAEIAKVAQYLQNR